MFFASLSFSLRPQRSAFLDKACFDSQLLVEECTIKTHTHTIVQNEEKKTSNCETRLRTVRINSL